MVRRNQDFWESWPRKAGYAAILLLALASVAGACCAQRNEIEVSVGALHTGVRTFNLPAVGRLSTDAGVVYGVNFGHQLAGVKVASVYGELQLEASPNRDIRSSNVVVPFNYSSLFLLPGIRVKILPFAGISPWLAAGAGYARFSSSTLLGNGQPNPSQSANTAAVDYGGGIDYVFIRFISFRFGLRDFYTGNPSLGVHFPNRQHNLIFSGGIVLRF